MNLIVVDDEAAALGTFLYHVVDEVEINCKMFHNNPLQCLDYMKDHVVDAAFLDIHMPGVDGVELAEKLVKMCPGIKIVFISGYAQEEEKISAGIGENLLGFCYKPYSKEVIFHYFARIREYMVSCRSIRIQTFGGFDVFVNNQIVKFNSAKSKELLALLVDRRGMYVEMGEAVANLWQNKDAEHGKRLYRDAVYRLRMALKQYNLYDIIEWSRARLAVKTANVQCDYWNCLKDRDKSLCIGDYMPSYEWSMDTQSALENLT